MDVSFLLTLLTVPDYQLSNYFFARKETVKINLLSRSATDNNVLVFLIKYLLRLVGLMFLLILRTQEWLILT